VPFAPDVVLKLWKEGLFVRPAKYYGLFAHC